MKWGSSDKSSDVPGHSTAWRGIQGMAELGILRTGPKKTLNPGKKHSSAHSPHDTATTQLAGHREGLRCLQLWCLGHLKRPKNEVGLN